MNDPRSYPDSEGTPGGQSGGQAGGESGGETEGAAGRHGPAAADLPPWERRDRYGFLNGLYLTIKDVLLTPGRFFARMPTADGLAQPLLFAVVIGVAGAFVSWMWTLTGSSLQVLLQDRLEDVVKGPLYSFFAFLTSPVAVVLGVFIKAALLHAMLMLLGGGKLGFEATFRVAAYSQAADVLTIVPFCGSFLGLVWGLVILVVGLHSVHRIEPWKAVAAVVVPMGLCLSMVGAGLALILLGLS